MEPFHTVNDLHMTSMRSFHVAANGKKRILFIGNSHTYCNGSVPWIIQSFNPAIAAEMVAFGGATCKSHWDSGIAKHVIDTHHENIDTVIFQPSGSDPLLRFDEAFEYLSKFVGYINNFRLPLLFIQTHPYGVPWLKRTFGNDTGMKPLDMHLKNVEFSEKVRSRLGLAIIEVGSMWMDLNKEISLNKLWTLYDRDDLHTNFRGAVVYAVCIYKKLGYAEIPDLFKNADPHTQLIVRRLFPE